MFNFTPLCNVVQMRVSAFIDHCQHAVPFGELVVLVHSCLFLCVAFLLFSVHLFFVCLCVCAVMWRNKGLNSAAQLSDYRKAFLLMANCLYVTTVIICNL